MTVSVRRISNPKPRFRPLERMVVERGTRDDWKLFHHLHYKAEGTPAGSRYWRLALDGETIGVLVTASPKLLLKERHKVFPKLKPGHDNKMVNTHRAKWLNRNMRVIARFVLDTRYRGVGIAYRFQNLVSRMEGVRFMEIQSSMSKYNLFAQRAGFRFAKPANSNKYTAGVQFFRRTFVSNPADHEGIVAEIKAMPPTHRERVLSDTKAFYYQHSAMEKTGNNRDKGTGRVDEMTPEVLIRNLQQLVLASPLYGVYVNPDAGAVLPDSLPLLAFDKQLPTEPLKR